MYAQHACRGGRPGLRDVAPQLCEHSLNLLARGCHCGCQKRCGAVPGVHSGEELEWFAAVHYVRTACAVDMQVDEAGNDQNVIVRSGVARCLRHEVDPILLNSNGSVTPA